MIDGTRDDLHELRGDGWQRLLAAARRRLERTGGALDGSIGLTAPTDAERRVVIGVTGVYRAETVRRLTVELAAVDRAVQQAHGIGLAAALGRLAGPLRDRPGERRTEAARRDRLLAVLDSGRHRSQPWYAAWTSEIAGDGTLTRLIRRGGAGVADWAVRVLDLLPVADATDAGIGAAMPLPVLAELATGDTKALVPGSPTASLVLRALALWADQDPPHDALGARLLWERAGAVADDLASQVLVLNVRTARDDVVGGWLAEAADFGIPFRLTLHQLTTSLPTVASPVIHVCENPAVLRAAAAELEDRSAALICTEGLPSAACRRLLDTAVRSGARLRVRADFDWTGLRITSSLLAAADDALPWRMSTADYEAALRQGDSTPLTGTAAASPWDPPLGVSMAKSGRAVMEERLLRRLLADLADEPR